MSKPGPKSKFAAVRYSIVQAVLSGATIAEVAEVSGIEAATLRHWLHKHPDFRREIKAAREIAAQDRAARLAQLFSRVAA